MREKKGVSSAPEFSEYEIPNSFTTRDGVQIDALNPVWVAGLNDRIDWSNAAEIPSRILWAVKAYVCQQLMSSSSGTGRSTFWRLVGGLSRIPTARLHEIATGEIGMDLFNAYKSALEGDPNISSGTAREMQSDFRRWYVWCVDAGFPGFLDEVSIELLEKTIGGGGKGWAVLSQDADEGPLGFLQDSVLEGVIASKLDHIDQLDIEELQSLTAVLLSKAYGLYGAHLQLLDERDHQVECLSDGSEVHWIQIPRLKKRGSRSRVGSRRRRLSTRISCCVERLKLANQRLSAARGSSFEADNGRPLFIRESRRASLVGTDLEIHAHRWSLQNFHFSMRNFARKNGIAFRLNPRRLRYTFATRLVEEGCSPMELADALDHTDMQHVMVYFDARSEVVRQLDESMAVRLAPFAMAFLGRVVSGPASATRADDPASVIRFRCADSDISPVGSCGTLDVCGLSAPIACYTCPRFEPWLDAPHELVLSELLKDRRRREANGLDEKLIQIHDRTILAVAEVVRRVSESAGDEKLGGDHGG